MSEICWKARAERAEAALAKVNEIRNSIVGAQAVNWSEHVYPLVAALDAAGLDGLGYEEARRSVGTARERAQRAEAQLAALREAARTALYSVAGDAVFGPSPALGVACRALDAALTDAAPAAEAHDRRVRAEALREAADRWSDQDDDVPRWLRARADEIEGGGR